MPQEDDPEDYDRHWTDFYNDDEPSPRGCLIMLVLLAGFWLAVGFGIASMVRS